MTTRLLVRLLLGTAQELRGLRGVLRRQSARPGSARNRGDVLRGVHVAAPAGPRLRWQRLSVRRRLGLVRLVRLLGGQVGPVLLPLPVLPVLLPLLLPVGALLVLPVRAVAALGLPLLRGVLLGCLRPPGLPPRPAAGRGGLVRRSSRRPGLSAARGQHDALVRGSYSRELLLVTLSALCHRDSYV